MTTKYAYSLPRIDESLSRLGKTMILTNIELAWVSWQIPVRKRSQIDYNKLLLSVSWDPSNSDKCLLGYAMLPPRSSEA